MVTHESQNLLLSISEVFIVGYDVCLFVEVTHDLLLKQIQVIWLSVLVMAMMNGSQACGIQCSRFS